MSSTSQLDFKQFIYERIVHPTKQVVATSMVESFSKSRDQILVDSDGKKSVVRDTWEVFLYDRHGSKYSVSNVYTVDFKV
jgi:hypothetical protein